LVADARSFQPVLRNLLRKHHATQFDAAICSPPYATALPYIDTQRLSLAMLGLVPASTLRQVERDLIGNREIGDRQRKDLESGILANTAHLPAEVASFCQMLLKLAESSRDHGFRRRNVPGLVYKYFVDMAQVFASVGELIQEGGRFVLLVGRNKTTLKGKLVEIDTPTLLASVAVTKGWVVDETLRLDTYKRFDLHRANSITHETLLILRRSTGPKH
jgi:hypothetical protein